MASVKKETKALKWDGKDIWTVLSGEEKLAPRSLYSAGTHFRSQSLRDGDWKLILFQNKNSKQERAELYNITQDPSEKANLASKEPERLQKMRRSLKTVAKNDQDSVALPKK